MIGNGLLAFAVIFVVVIFVYISMKASRDKEIEKKYTESYTINLNKGFQGRSYSIFVNDSLLFDQLITEEPATVEVQRFADQSAVLIVDNETEILSTFDLSEKGGIYSFVKDEDGIKLLGQSGN